MFRGLSCCKLRVAVFALQNYTADSINYSAPLPRADFEEAMKKYDISESYFLAFGHRNQSIKEQSLVLI